MTQLYCALGHLQVGYLIRVSLKLLEKNSREVVDSDLSHP